MESIILINKSELINVDFKRSLNLLRTLGFLKECDLIKEDTYKMSSLKIKEKQN